jgi:hypothetical protein
MVDWIDIERALDGLASDEGGFIFRLAVVLAKTGASGSLDCAPRRRRRPLCKREIQILNGLVDLCRVLVACS